MAKKKRNYRKEYDTYHAKPSQKKARASRNSARKKMAKSGKVRKGDGREVAHKNGDPQRQSQEKPARC